MTRLRTERLESVVALGAHCDDIAIGAGGSLLAICAARPGIRVDALVLSGGGTGREDEEHAALRAFCPGADLDVSILTLPDGRFPARWDTAKEALESLRARTEPDLILAPRTGDAHQDHRTLARLVPTVWRGPLILGYEIAKWDGDLGALGAYLPLTDEAARRKVELLGEHYPSQRGRSWYDPEAFLGLARLRGIECRHRYAEAFEVTKVTLDVRARREEPACASC